MGEMDGVGIPGTPDGPPEVDYKAMVPVMQGAMSYFNAATEAGFPPQMAFEFSRDFVRSMTEALIASAAASPPDDEQIGDASGG